MRGQGAGLRAIVDRAAAEAGHRVDVDQVLGRLEAATRAFKRRAATPEPAPADVRRRRLRRLAAAANALEDALAALGHDACAAMGVWPSGPELDAWRQGLERLACRAETLHDREARPAKPGPRPDGATRALVRDVAWTLALAGLPVTAHPFGLLAAAAREVAALAGRALWADENVRGQLRPAVRFVRRMAGAIPPSGDRNLSPTASAAGPASSVH